MRNTNNTSGTFLGDPNGSWIQINTSINGTALVASGMLSYYGTIIPLNVALTLPAPSATNITYISVQTNLSGTLQLYTSTVSAPALQSSNLMEVYSDQVPINAATDEIITTDSEPTLD